MKFNYLAQLFAKRTLIRRHTNRKTVSKGAFGKCKFLKLRGEV